MAISHSPDPSLSLRTLCDLFALGLIWGASFLTVRLALNEVSVLSSVCHRVFWASLVLWVIVKLRRMAIPGSARFWGACLMMGLLNNVLPFALMAWGTLHIETGLTSILNATTAIWAALAAALVFPDERLTWQRTIGLILGFAGVVVLIGPDALSGFDLRSAAQIVVILGTLSYAAASVWARMRLQAWDPMVAAAGMLTSSSALIIPVTLFREGSIGLPQTITGLTSILYYAVFATAVAYLLYYRLVRDAGAGGAMLVTLLIPPVAIALGSLVLGEALGPMAYVGLGVLGLGLIVLSLRPRSSTA